MAATQHLESNLEYLYLFIIYQFYHYYWSIIINLRFFPILVAINKINSKYSLTFAIFKNSQLSLFLRWLIKISRTSIDFETFSRTIDNTERWVPSLNLYLFIKILACISGQSSGIFKSLIGKKPEPSVFIKASVNLSV